MKDQVLDAFEMLLVGMLFCFFVNAVSYSRYMQNRNIKIEQTITRETNRFYVVQP